MTSPVFFQLCNFFFKIHSEKKKIQDDPKVTDNDHVEPVSAHEYLKWFCFKTDQPVGKSGKGQQDMINKYSFG